MSASLPPPKDAAQRPLDFTIIRRLFSYTNRHGSLRNALFFLVILRSIQLPIVTWLIARVVSGPIAERDPSGTWLGVLVFLTAAAFTEFCFVYRMRCALELGELVVRDLRQDIYAHLLRMPISYFKHVQVGRLIGRITSDVDVVRVGVQDVAFVSTVQIGTMLVSATLMLYYDWQLFFVVLVMAPILWAIVSHFRKKLSAAYRAQQESFTRITATLAESVNGIREIQGFVRQNVNGGLFGQLVYDHSKYNMGSARQSAVFQPLLEFNGQLFLSILLVVGGYQALHGRVGLEALIQFLFLSNAFFAGIPIIGNQYNQALTAMAGAERVFALLDRQPEWEDSADARPIPRLAGAVEFRELSFEYEPGRRVLEGVSFTVRANQTVALVGHTGSGKSTIVNLIAKLYLPTSGELLIDGVEIRALSGPSLHRQIAGVTQENFLFTGTVLDNVRVGRPAASDQEAREAIAQLGVLDLLEALPQGLNTLIGERGAGISVGQRQLVCFARAMLADPRILILDEATSSVDSMTEARVQEALVRLLDSRTSFVIAHRLSTIKNADVVIVMDHGRIAEMGTHRELIAKGGHYAGMYRQFMGGGDARAAVPA